MTVVWKYLLLILMWVHGSKAYKEPYFVDNRTTIVHLFEWTWPDIARECEEFLGPQGYGGVQISPPNEVSDIEEGPWWARYQPVSYQLVSKSGNEHDLADMIKRCNADGVRVYVDTVVNHMSGYKEGMTYGTGGSVANYVERRYPAVPYGPQDFNAACDIENYQDAAQVRNCQLVTLLDLNQTSPYVRKMIVNYMNNLVNMGVAGFRIDAAKHMWPADLEAIYGELNNLCENAGFPSGARPYIYQEVIDLGSEAVKKTEYNHLGAVTEFKFSSEIGRVFRNLNSLKSLKNWGPEMELLPSEDAIIFVDNHDNQRGHGAGGADILTFKQPELYKLAVAFMLAHPYGKVTRVMSSYNFTNTDQGPPRTAAGAIRPPQLLANNLCDTANVGWVCEHRWPAIYQMVQFRRLVGQEPLTAWWENGENQIAFSRGPKGFVVFNMETDQELKASVQTGLTVGSYCDVLFGFKQNNACSGVKVTVNEEGLAAVELPKGPAALAVTIASKL